ncbi:MAG: hypothetical protein KIT84_03540 [Labilithrix sp.]|nr:hypothetical protein [Labilithrix sp.]MCW5810057.1 hypothetical protein [Labilithrix sp.]
MKRAAAFLLLIACNTSPSEEPTSTLAPSTPADTCDEARFAGTFDFPAAVHRGDTPYCEAVADGWNETERPRSLSFWRNADGTWSSADVGEPEAGAADYTLDTTACALRSVAPKSAEPRDLVVAAPVSVVTTVTLTPGGVAMERTQSHAAASSLPDLLCRIRAVTEGVTRA